MKSLNCISCGLTYPTLEKLKFHLENHVDLSIDDKNEIVKDVIDRIKRAEIKLHKSERRALKRNLSQQRLEQNLKKTDSHKRSIIDILKTYDVSPDFINKVNNMSTINKINLFIKNNLKKEFQESLYSSKVDLRVKEKAKPKSKKRYSPKEYNDRTVASVRVIFTPMGNKK